ncbi:MAG: RNA pyrophosphohydrolase, partial [Gammaproteobacteria bacterium]|nr:RNA pyrophosphohydrolase [Gammaproteobacteria bacterium]
WLRYEVPYAPRPHYFRRHRGFRGQKQRWFLFRLLAEETSVRLDTSDNPEFDYWTWVDYWRPVHQIVQFKRSVYLRALTELEPFLLRL